MHLMAKSNKSICDLEMLGHLVAICHTNRQSNSPLQIATNTCALAGSVRFYFAAIFIAAELIKFVISRRYMIARSLHTTSIMVHMRHCEVYRIDSIQ